MSEHEVELTNEERAKIVAAYWNTTRDHIHVERVVANIVAARLADAEARAENRGIRLAAELVRGHSIDGTGEQIARFLEARADRRMTAEQARGDQ